MNWPQYSTEKLTDKVNQVAYSQMQNFSLYTYFTVNNLQVDYIHGLKAG